VGSGLIAIGVDGARGGWIAACLDDEGRTSLRLFGGIEELAAARGDAIVALDMPIGLTDGGGPRACDLEAKRRLGAAASSVFAAPARYLLEAIPSVSAQAAALARKIVEVDVFARATPGCERWLFEAHPELSFRALGDGPLRDKRSPAGAIERLRRIQRRFPDAGDQLAAAPWSGTKVGLDDALDAYAVLATAVAIRDRRYDELGDGAWDGEGLPMRIVVARDGAWRQVDEGMHRDGAPSASRQRNSSRS
jgi:predicted RNase H-like nuclease